MDEEIIERIKLYTNVVSGHFERSLSGVIEKIDRKDIGTYREPDSAIYQSIFVDENRYNYPAAFETMLKYKTGDCFEQSHMLAMILKNIPIIDKNYRVFISSLVESEKNHSFLVLIPRDGINGVMKKLFIDNEDPSIELSGSACLNKPEILVVDPWRNMVFDSGITESAHPVSYIESFDFGKARFCLQNMDICYTAFKSQLKSIIQPTVDYGFFEGSKYINIQKLAKTIRDIYPDTVMSAPRIG